MTDWQVTLDSLTTRQVSEQIGDDLMDALADYGAAFGIGDQRISVTLTIEGATDPTDAITQARTIWHAALVEGGLTIADVRDVEARALTYDQVERELAQPTIPELWGANEAAEHLGVSRQRVHQLATENPGFPSPVVRVAMGPLWVRASIEAFGRAWDRTPGRRRALSGETRPLRGVSGGQFRQVRVSETKQMGKAAAARQITRRKDVGQIAARQEKSRG